MDNEKIRENAYKDYVAGMKYKDIADKYNVSINTVKSCKTRYGWRKDGKTEILKKSMHTKKEKVCIQNKRNTEKEKALEGWADKIIEDADLTSKQGLFCIYYANSNNATVSYQKAYACNRKTAMAAGSRMLRNVKVREEIERLKKEKYEAAMFDERDIFQWHLDVATANITDYISFGRETIPVTSMFGSVIDKQTGEQMTKEVNYVKFRESDEVDGRIIKKVKMGKDGASIELYDAVKSLEWLEKNMKAGTDAQRSLAGQIIDAYRQREKQKDDGK